MYNMNAPARLSKRSLRNEVFDILHRRVIAGELQPGEWLRQDVIASQLGVSMTPVREALDSLVAAGLAQREPYRGVRVIELTHEEMLDAYGLRLMIEPAAARLASESTDPAQGDALSVSKGQELKRLLARTMKLVRLTDMSSLRELSRQFHALIVEMSGSPLLLRVYQMAANKFPDWMLYEAMFRHPKNLKASLRDEQAQHRAIVDAILNHDAETAARAAHDHLLSLGNDLHVYLSIPREKILEKEKQFPPL